MLRRFLSSSTTSGFVGIKKLNLFKHIDKIKNELVPPVSNKVIINDKIQVMIVGGPNDRRDFHIEMGEELFYQIKGSMDLDVILDGTRKARFNIKEGDMFILPAGIPHSPQRYADTIGLVFERMRSENEIDCLRWYKQSNLEIDYEEYFHCKDLGTQVKAVIENYNKVSSSREKQDPLNTEHFLTNNLAYHSIFKQQLSSLLYKSNIACGRSLQDSASQFLQDSEKVREIIFDGEFRMTLIKGDRSSHSAFSNELQSINQRSADSSDASQRCVFLWQLKGESQIISSSKGDRSDSIHMEEGDISLMRFDDPQNLSLVPTDSSSCTIIITNKNT